MNESIMKEIEIYPRYCMYSMWKAELGLRKQNVTKHLEVRKIATHRMNDVEEIQ